jgi:cell fate regulator YaaT (PSP1 superfamily)
MTTNVPENKAAPAAAPKPEGTRRVAGVLFSRAGKIEFFLADGIEAKTHDLVVIKGDHQNVVGRLIVEPKDVPSSDVATNIRQILRKAAPDDIEQFNQIQEKARQGLELCARKAAEKGLPMKLIDVSYEDNKAIFFFFAEERVDFRALVKELASALHMRIEMRQVGSRDEAKAIGALGPCGEVCCCERFLKEFNSIGIAMAKTQGLTPNPAKLTGMCGKLKCCLHYENATYLEERKNLPPVGSKVKTSSGQGVITALDVLKHQCTVRVDKEDGFEEVRCPCQECEVLQRPKTAEKGRGKNRAKDETDKEDKEYEKLEG